MRVDRTQSLDSTTFIELPTRLDQNWLDSAEIRSILYVNLAATVVGSEYEILDEQLQKLVSILNEKELFSIFDIADFIQIKLFSCVL